MAASLFTPDARAAVLEALSAGCSLRDAAHQAGVNDQTLKGWLAKGRQEREGDYHAFAVAVDQARSSAEPLGPLGSKMDWDELEVVVSDAARKGNTQAMKLRLEMLRSQMEAADVPADPLAALDELAERRAARA